MFKNCLKIFIALGALLGMVLIIFSITNNPKTPVTAEQVWSILEAQEFIPSDTTQLYKDEWGNNGNGLTQVVSTESDDIRFDFFVFDSQENAESIRKLYQSFINSNRYCVPNVEIKTGSANYMIYTLKAKGIYTVNIRVGHTLIFAYANEENASKVDSIIQDMDYFQ